MELNATQFSELLKTALAEDGDCSEEQTAGVAMARENRRACNDLSEDERSGLTDLAMSIIYGGNGPRVPANRP